MLLFDKQKGIIKNYKHNKKGLPSNNIRVTIEDDKGNLWIGTENRGIVKFNVKDNTFKLYQYKENTNSLSSNNIKSLYYDANDILWIGTNGKGLNALSVKEEKFHHYTEKDGLANNVIYAILPDKKAIYD